MGSGVGMLYVYAFAATQTVPNTKTTVLLDVTPYSLVYKCRRFEPPISILMTEEPAWGKECSSLIKMRRNITLKFGIYLTDYLGTHAGRE